MTSRFTWLELGNKPSVEDIRAKTPNAVFVSDGAGRIYGVLLGADGTVLTSTGTDTPPVFEAASSGVDAEEGALDGGSVVVTAATAFNFDSDYFDVVLSADGTTAWVTLRASSSPLIIFEGLTDTGPSDITNGVAFEGLTVAVSYT